MANELEKAITIKSAIDKIDAGDFITLTLNSIQKIIRLTSKESFIKVTTILF
jgi:hypothetical protein